MLLEILRRLGCILMEVGGCLYSSDVVRAYHRASERANQVIPTGLRYFKYALTVCLLWKGAI